MVLEVTLLQRARVLDPLLTVIGISGAAGILSMIILAAIIRILLG